MCRRCRRPTSVCYCVALQQLDTVTRVVILQHPRERDMPIGTAHMARLCLPQAELHVGVRWSESAPLARALSEPARPPILLYPGRGARDILRDPPRGPVTLVVVDGTWSQAKTVVRDNPVLHALPRYAFATPEPSHYRIRREPNAEYVSTIEALMHVLGALEGDPSRFRGLLDPLNRMIDAHLACRASSPRRRVQRQRPRQPSRRYPEVLTRRFDDLVCVVGEANAWPYRERAVSPPDELIHWVAHRVATGEIFERIAAPEQALSPSTSFHTELSEDVLRHAAPRAELLAGYARFSRPSDVVCVWGTFGLGLFAASGGTLPAERIDLRAMAQRITQRKLGSLEDYAATIPGHDLSVVGHDRPASAEPPRSSVAGRAGRRLALLVHVVRAWHALASAEEVG
jgi:DTW domain-containing protein